MESQCTSLSPWVLLLSIQVEFFAHPELALSDPYLSIMSLSFGAGLLVVMINVLTKVL